MSHHSLNLLANLELLLVFLVGDQLGPTLFWISLPISNFYCLFSLILLCDDVVAILSKDYLNFG